MSIVCGVISLPIAYFSNRINTLLPYYLEEGVAYQKTLMYFAFFQPIRIALTAFFVGQEKTKIITFAPAVGVMLNIILDYLLIYGVKNVIPAMGCREAAIATVAAEFIQVMILAAVFFNRKNRNIYKTFENRRFNAGLFWDCIKMAFRCRWEIAWR